MYRKKKKENYNILFVNYNLSVTYVHSQNKMPDKLMQKFIVEFKFKVVHYKIVHEVFAKQFG